MKEYLIKVWKNQLWFTELERETGSLVSKSTRVRGELAKNISTSLASAAAEIDQYTDLRDKVRCPPIR
jgi:hypothetical protein